MAEYATPEETARFLALQRADAKGPQPALTCECGRVMAIRWMYKCLYCDLWFCQSCMEIHCGKTRAQYREEKASNAELRGRPLADGPA